MAENGYSQAAVPGHIGRIPNYGKTQFNPMGSVEPPACIQNAMMTKDKKPFTYTPGGLDLSQIKTPSMARRMARQRSQEEHEQAYAPSNGVAYHPQGGPQGGGFAPPPPPPPMQGPPPPPPPPQLVINVPQSKSPKPPVVGERPEIVIPENPIGMLRRTNSPYHWEAEKADMQRMGPVPKFVEKAPSPLSVQMPPSSFSQQPPQSFQRQNFNNNQTPDSPVYRPEAQYASQKQTSPNVASSPPMREMLQRQDSQFNKSPAPFGGQSPVNNGGNPFSPTQNNSWRQPERRDSPVYSVPSPQSIQPPFNRSPMSPNNQQTYSPNSQNSSSPLSPQFSRGPLSPNNQYTQNSPNSYNSSPQPQLLNRGSVTPNQQSFSSNNHSPANNVSSSPNTQQFSRGPLPSPNQQQLNISNSQSPASNTSQPQVFGVSRPLSPNVHQMYLSNPNQSPGNNSSPNFHTLPRSSAKAQDINVSQAGQQSPANSAPWRTNAQNKQPESVPNIYHNSQPINQQPTYTPPWKLSQDVNNNQAGPNKNQTGNQQQYNPPWVAQDTNNNRVQQEEYNAPWKTQDKPNPASSASKPNQQQEQRFQSTVTIPVAAKKPEPEPINKQREAVYVNQEPVYYCPDSPNSVPPWVKAQKEKTKTPPPAWVQRPLDGNKCLQRELATPPRDSQAEEPEWVKKSNEMQRAAREVTSPPKYQQTVQPNWSTRPSENRKSLPKDSVPNLQPGSRMIPIQMEVTTTETRDQGRQGNPQPHLRITVGMQPHPNAQGTTQGSFSQPTQRIMRVLSPQLVRMEDGPPQQTELPTLNKGFQGSQDSHKTRIIPIQIEGGNSDGANKRVYYHHFTQEGPPRQSKAFRVLQVITGTQDVGDMHNFEQEHGFSDL